MERIKSGKETTRNSTQDTLTLEEEDDEDKHLNSTQNPLDDNETSLLVSMINGKMDDGIWINAKTTASQDLHMKYDKKEEITLEEQIPKEFHEWLDVFDKKKADQFPEERVWDHKIELKPGFEPNSFKTYSTILPWKNKSS